jgi:hypothetical protein
VAGENALSVLALHFVFGVSLNANPSCVRRVADGGNEGDASVRKRPSQGIALEAVFSTASPLPAGGVQLLSHLEGETEAAGALLERFDPEVSLCLFFPF